MTKFIKLFDTLASGLEVQLEKGDSVNCAPGSMISMSDSFNVSIQSTSTDNILNKILKASNSFVKYTAHRDGQIVLSPKFLGDIEILDVNLNSEYLISKNNYLASESTIDLKSIYEGKKAMIAGTSLKEMLISGTGKLALASTGNVIKKSLKENETLIINSNHLILRDKNAQFSIHKLESTLTSLESREGHILKFVGPAELWYQTKNLNYFIDCSVN